MRCSKPSYLLWKVGRLLALGLLGIIGALMVLIILFQSAQSNHRGIDDREKAELKSIFSRAIAEGSIFDPPADQESFSVTSRHGNDPYIISYTNSTGERVGFFASKNFPYGGLWTFKDLARKQPDWYRLTNE